MIYIASDHAGFAFKHALLAYLKEKGLAVEDMGPFVYEKSDDYPDFIYPCAVKVAMGQSNEKGIVIGFSGQGEAIVANKVRGIRAAIYPGGNLDIVKLSREHNDSNILSLGAGFLTVDEAKQALDLWLATPFAGERHLRRINKIKEIEKRLYK